MGYERNQRLGIVKPLRSGQGFFLGLVAVILTAAAVPPLAAQLNSVPVLAPEIPERSVPVKVYVGYGRGLNDESGNNTAWVLSADLLLGSRVTVGGALGCFNPTGPSGRDWSGQGGLRGAVAVLHRGLIREFAIQVGGGGGYQSASDRTIWESPFFVAFSYQVETVGVTFAFSAAPRVAARRTSVGPVAVMQAGGGIAGDARAFVPAGMGLVVSVDWSTWGEATDGSLTIPSSHPLVLGIALRKGL